MFVDRKDRDDALGQIQALTRNLTSQEGVAFPGRHPLTPRRQRAIRESLTQKMTQQRWNWLIAYNTRCPHALPVSSLYSNPFPHAI